MQWALHTVETWSNEVGLSVNPNKTEFVVFTRRRKLPGFSEPHFLGVTLSWSRSVKYLGVILDFWLIWREHVDVKVRKAHHLLWALGGHVVQRGAWDLQVVHWFCISIIGPSITCASLVWCSGCQMACAKKTLSRVQRFAFFGIMGAIHTTPTGAWGTYWSPSSTAGDSRWGVVSGVLSLESGMLVQPSHQART